jgi:hypothetical protein
MTIIKPAPLALLEPKKKREPARMEPNSLSTVAMCPNQIEIPKFPKHPQTVTKID